MEIGGLLTGQVQQPLTNEVEPRENSMLEINGTFLLVALNLLLLYLILKRMLFTKVTVFMEKRADSIKHELDNADSSRKDAEKMKDRYEEQLRAAQIEIEKVLVDAQVKAGKKYDDILTTAKQEVDRLRKEAKEDIEIERDKMIREVKGHIANLAVQAASKVIDKNMDTEENRVLVDKFLDEEGAA